MAAGAAARGTAVAGGVGGAAAAAGAMVGAGGGSEAPAGAAVLAGSSCLVIERVTGRLGVDGESVKLSEFGKPERMSAVRAVGSSTLRTSVEVRLRPAGRASTDCERLLLKVTLIASFTRKLIPLISGFRGAQHVRLAFRLNFDNNYKLFTFGS